jgi:hypothetical protein
VLLTELCTGKPIQTYTSFSSFERQTAVKPWWNPYHELPAILPDSNWLRHEFATGLQIGNDLSRHLTDTFECRFWCGG